MFAQPTDRARSVPEELSIRVLFEGRIAVALLLTIHAERIQQIQRLTEKGGKGELVSTEQADETPIAACELCALT